MEAEDKITAWLNGPLFRFQQIVFEPLSERLAAGEQIGPSWSEVVDNDWSLGERPPIESGRAKFARLGFDAMSCLTQLDACAEGLRDLHKRRVKFPSFGQAELLLIASDSIVYRLLERCASFSGHPAIRKLGRGSAGAPKLLRDIKRRRGSYTHHFDEPLMETSSSSILLGVIRLAESQSEERIRSLVHAEARRVYLDRLMEKILGLDEVSQEAFVWVSGLFETTEQAWTDFLRQEAKEPFP